MSASDPVGSTRSNDTLPPAARSYNQYIAPFARPFAEAVADRAAELLGAEGCGVDRSGVNDVPVILDHGAGTGLVGQLLLARLPGASVTALDPNADLLAVVPAPIRTIAGTASAPLDTLGFVGPADAVVSNLVLPFCDDAVADLTNLRHATRRGGVLVLTSLGLAPVVGPFHAFWSSVHEVVVDAWPPERYVHHRFGDPEVLASAVRAAGWIDVRATSIRGERDLDASGAWEWLSASLPIGVGSAYGAITEDQRATVRTRFLARWDADPATHATTVTLVSAIAP
jgi:SAM-dependent methyltransferase